MTDNATISSEPARPPRILIVDDEAANLAALRATLSQHGYETEGYTDPAEGLAAVQRGAFGLLLADLMMPGMGGVELLREAQARDPDLVGVIMTGEGTIASAVEAMKTGALDYVLKPLKLRVILPVLSRALTMRSLRIENAELDRRVRERTVELEAAVEEVEKQTAERLKAEQALMQAQKMEAIGRLTGGVAHDFNNLLTAVTGNLELLQRKLDEQAPYRRFVDNALEAAQRGAKVTAQLLAFSRTQRLALQPVDIDATFLKSDALLRHALGPDARLAINLGAGGVWSNTDATQLELAVLNLIVNARDALPDGGDIRLQTRIEDERVVVEVSDTGIGMPPEVLERATEPFFTTKKGSGSGLGLAQVYGFARQCGGDCVIESTPGLGTRVRIILPVTAPPELEAESHAVPPAGPTQALRILVVDDDDQVRQALCDGLESEGYFVLQASDGPGGLRVLDTERPDVLVLDYAMPVMTGAEVARRAQMKHPRLPIVFCSGFADSLALDEVGASVVLRKPIAIADLSRAVCSAAATTGTDG